MATPSFPDFRRNAQLLEGSVEADTYGGEAMEVDNANRQVVFTQSTAPLSPPDTPQNASFHRNQTFASGPWSSGLVREDRVPQSSTPNRRRARNRGPHDSSPAGRSTGLDSHRQSAIPGQSFYDQIDVSDDDSNEDLLANLNIPGSFPQEQLEIIPMDIDPQDDRIDPPMNQNDITTTLATIKSAATIDERIRKNLLKPLSFQNYAFQGSIYIWYTETHPNLVKIGRSEMPQQRAINQSRTCNLRLQHLDIPHTHFLGCKRAELLIHQELANFRARAPTCECDTEHREWFQVSQELAKEVVARWTQFVESEPYEEIGTQGRRVLKDMYKRRLHSMPRPMEAVETPLDHAKRRERWNKVLLASDWEFLTYHMGECVQELRRREWTWKGVIFRLLLVFIARACPSFYQASFVVLLGSAVADTGLFR